MLSICLAMLQNPEDKPRFEEFFNKFYDTVFYVAKKHLKTVEAAEDCAQEIMEHFAKDFHNIKQDFDDAKFKAYVKIVAKGMAIDMYRKEKKHLDNLVDADISEFYNLSEEVFDVSVCDTMLLKEAIDALPENLKLVFYLKYIYEYSGEEIAEKLNFSKPLVRKRCMLGMQFVRNYIEESLKEKSEEGEAEDGQEE